MKLTADESDLLRFCAEIFPPEPPYQRFVNEARFGLSRILPHLARGERQNVQILEVGAGSCILAAYLASRGAAMSVVEPLGPEFAFFTDLQRRVLDFCGQNGIELALIRCTGEQLDIADRFDFAYTINALEHMRDPFRTIDNIYRSLRPGGMLLAHCPNYHVPFEVHFNIVLITRSKALNQRLYRSAISRYPSIWDELNFVTLRQVRRHLRSRGYAFAFNRSVFRDSVWRLIEDPIFAERMPAMLRPMASALRRTGLVGKLNWLPLSLQTPMEFTVSKTATPGENVSG
jgi:SAM-dependent methyltransferase